MPKNLKRACFNLLNEYGCEIVMGCVGMQYYVVPAGDAVKVGGCDNCHQFSCCLCYLRQQQLLICTNLQFILLPFTSPLLVSFLFLSFSKKNPSAHIHPHVIRTQALLLQTTIDQQYKPVHHSLHLMLCFC